MKKNKVYVYLNGIDGHVMRIRGYQNQLTLFALVLISPFPVDSVAVDFVAAVAAVRPTQCDTERYASLVVNVTVHPFDN